MRRYAMVGWFAFALLWVMGMVPSAAAYNEMFPSGAKGFKILILIWPLLVLVVLGWVGACLVSDGWFVLKAHLSKAKTN